LTSALLLIDGDQNPFGAIPLPGAPIEAGVATVAVVLALNQNSLQKVPDWPALLDSVARLAQALAPGARLASFEPLVVLIAPESADQALVRSVRNAAPKAYRGPFQRLWIITKDTGLRRAICESVRANPVLDSTGSLWVAKPTPFRREATILPSPSGGEAGGRWTARIGHAPYDPAWFAHQPPQADTPAQLARITDPAALTQVGPVLDRGTWGLSGVARLAAWCRGERSSTLGRCSERDGLEYGLSPAEAWPPAIGAPLLVSVGRAGRGSVFFSWPGHGVAALSSLPTSVLSAATPAFSPVPRVIDDRTMLSSWKGQPLPSTVRISADVGKGELHGEVMTEAWWWTRDRRTAKQRCRFPSGLGPFTWFDSPAFLVKYGDGLAFQRTGGERLSARLLSPLGPGQPGRAEAIDGKPVVIVALAACPLGMYDLVPLQVVPPEEVPAQYRREWASWALLPLMTPVGQLQSAPTVRGTAGEAS
jgi:hypothetical protein